MAPVYLYTGPEFGMRDEAAQAVLKALQKKFGEIEEHVYYLNETSIGQALSVLDNGNLFSSATCVICKNAELLNRIGEKLAAEYGVNYLCSDFKKKEGYKRSIELSKQYDLYRQNYCGCIFSREKAPANVP